MGNEEKIKAKYGVKWFRVSLSLLSRLPVRLANSL